MAIPIHVLLVEDNPFDAELALRELRWAGFDPRWKRVETEAEYVASLEPSLDVILADHSLPQFDNGRALQLLQRAGLDIPFIIVSGTIGEEAIVTAMKQGAADYLLKDRMARLGQAVAQALETRQLRRAQRETAAALREKDERYRALFERTNDAVFIIDLEGKHLAVNQQAANLLDYSIEELLGLSYQEIVAPSELEDANQKFKRILAGESLPLYEHTFRRRDGTTFPVEISVALVRDQEGKPLHIQSVVRDITERKRTEAEINRRNRELALLNRVIATAASTLQPEVVLQKTCHELALAFDTPQTVAALIDKNDARLVIVAETPGQAASQVIGQYTLIAESKAIQHVLQHRSPLVIHNARHDPRLSAFMSQLARQRNIASLIILPLIVRRQVLGVISLGSVVPRDFTGEEIALAANAAGAAAQAIENARLFDETRQRARELDFLNRVITAATSTLDEVDLLQAVCAELAQFYESTQTAMALLKENNVFEITAAYPPDGAAPLIGRRMTITDASPFQELLDSSRPLTIDDVDTLPLTESIRLLLTEVNVKSLLMAPVSVRGALMGVLQIGSEAVRRFTSQEVRLAQTVGEELGRALETIRLLQQIQKQARQVQQIVDTVPEGLLLLDANHRIEIANPAAQAYLELLSGVSVGDVLTHLDTKPLSALLHDTPEDWLWHEIELSEKRRTFEVAVRALDGGADSQGWILLLRDVTEERKRQQYFQVQERLATVGQLAAGIAHDFNNIMAVITLYSQLLLQAADLSTKHQERLKTIHQQANRAANLIRQILDFSRQSVMERAPVDLLPFMKELWRLLERTLTETIQINLVHESGEYLVNADLTRLQQVIMNLAVNARDAMLDGGSLRLTLNKVEFGAGRPPPLPDMAPGTWITFEMADSGIGIPSVDLPHIFEPFFTTKSPEEGTGLGLAQVYGIVKQHNGYIDVTSRVGKGTTFTIYLPALTTGSGNVSGRTRELAIPGQGETILLVEDNQVTRQAVAEVLETLNYRVLTAVNGEEALSIFNQRVDEIALVLSDLVMPGMGGAALHARLRQHQPDVKMVVMTGYPLQSEDKALLKQGIISWIQKPFEVAQIARVLREALDRAE